MKLTDCTHCGKKVALSEPHCSFCNTANAAATNHQTTQGCLGFMVIIVLLLCFITVIT